MKKFRCSIVCFITTYLYPGLIGLHTPEFLFDHAIDNVRWAAKNRSIVYPIAVDNDYSIWNGFVNRHWPALYFIDPKGETRNARFGEGEYIESEKMIQQLLKESGATDVRDGLVNPTDSGYELAPNWNNLRSPENYLGSLRTQNLASSGAIKEYNHNVFAAPSHLPLNQWGLAGEWIIAKDLILLNKANGKFYIAFTHVTAHGNETGETGTGNTISCVVRWKPPVNLTVLILTVQVKGSIREQRMYHLIRQHSKVGERLFEIEFMEKDVEAFSFTFG